MIILLALLAAQGTAAQDTVRGTVRDATTNAPVVAAFVTASTARTTSDEQGRFTLPAPPGVLRVRRVGYRARSVAIGGDEVTVYLTPVVPRLPELQVRGTSPVGRLAVTRNLADAGVASQSSLSEVLARLPFVSARSSRGGLALSMRGSRPEQVLVLLDGMPLNDPATGTADVADLPLGALGGITVVPGAAAALSGSGASGGVLSLHSGGGSSVGARAGSFGRVGVDGAHVLTIGSASARLGAEWSYARNDFRFVNTEGVRDTVERRVNSDEQRTALFGSVLLPFAHVAMMATRVERGLAGPMNVRALDAARGVTRRGLVRVAVSPREWSVTAGVRVIDSDYRDPRAVSLRATSLSADAEVGRRLQWLSLRVGAGVDRVHSAALRDSPRPRAFAAADRDVGRGRWRAALALRADAIQDAGVSVSPSLALERRGSVTLFARAAQAFRAPTFYDLYLATPQWADARRLLSPERVVLDGELGLRASTGSLALSAAFFERRTHDAIVWFPGSFDWSPKNVARERVRGIEGRAELTSDFLDVGAWGSWRTTRLRVDQVTVPTPYVPYADGGAEARARFGRLTLSGTLALIGRRPFVSIPKPSPNEELAAVALLDVDATWRPPILRDQTLVSVGVRNVSDARWQSVVRYPTAGRGWAASVTFIP